MANSAEKAWLIVKRLALGITLICAASAFLLLSDLQRRKKGMPQVAVLKYSTRPLLDAAVDGMIDGLARHGYVADETIALRIYDAQNEIPIAANIAKEITDGRYDLVMTASTPCLQAVARANAEGKCKHVFCAVTDPFGAGVGINRDNPLDHPPHLAGIGTFQPVELLFRLVKKDVFPGLKTVGVVWNPAEACSEACTIKARKICDELGIELLEATVDKSSDVPDAANSLVSRGVEVIWIGGDNTVELAIDALVAAGRKGRIPIITHGPDNLENGILMALGANYREVGLIAGEMAAKVLGGDDMAKMPVEDVVPEKLAINVLALRGLKDPWRISPEMLERADIVCDEKGTHRTEQPKVAK